MDTRNLSLAKNLVNYSCKLKPGEKILIELRGIDGIPLLNQVIKEVYKVGGIPFTNIYNEQTERELLLGASEEQLTYLAELDAKRMSDMDAYIGIKAYSNINELSDISSEQHQMYSKIYTNLVHFKHRVPNTKWVILRYPNSSMAQLANKSVESFSEFYYNVCNLDYNKMDIALTPLKRLMEKTDKVKIKGPNTELSFSIKGVPSIKCSGQNNIPDGEIFTAPIKDSVNGIIAFNVPSEYQGFTFDNIKLEFKDGKIINAVSNNTEKINKILDTDEGSRFIGEFALGINPYILEPMNDILFDEKIMGSFHFTPGAAYKEAFNENISSIHWDLVCIQTENYGGGEIYFDDVLIRKNGLFVLDELKSLNPENLK